MLFQEICKGVCLTLEEFSLTFSYLLSFLCYLLFFSLDIDNWDLKFLPPSWAQVRRKSHKRAYVTGRNVSSPQAPGWRSGWWFGSVPRWPPGQPLCACAGPESLLSGAGHCSWPTPGWLLRHFPNLPGHMVPSRFAAPCSAAWYLEVTCLNSLPLLPAWICQGRWAFPFIFMLL